MPLPWTCPRAADIPTNIVAETNVVIDVLDDNGKTNHITADKAVYAYHLFNPATNVLHSITNVTVYAGITNESITFYRWPSHAQGGNA